MLPDLEPGIFENCTFLTEEQKSLTRDRAQLLVKCELDEKTRLAVLKACKEGVKNPDGTVTPPYLFFLRNFGWIKENRNPPGFQKLPFIPYPYQVTELEFIYDAITKGQGILGKRTTAEWLKSRDMGLTWIVLAFFVWYFLFRGGIFHVGSRKEDEVDYKGNADTLFGKMRFLIYNLPEWMIPGDLIDKHNLLAYHDEEFAITGESANPGFGRGQRKTGVLMDEFQKWEYDRQAYRAVSQTSNVIFLVGTPEGTGNYYATIARKNPFKAIIRRIHWMLHPLKSQGSHYKDGELTSPWKEEQKSAMEDEDIAGELELSFEGSAKGARFASIYGALHQKTGLKALPGTLLKRGWDLGGTYYVLFAVRDKWNRIRCIHELCGDSKTVHEIQEEVDEITKLLEDEIDCPLDTDDKGDPAGQNISSTAAMASEYTLLSEKGIHVQYATIAAIPTQLRANAKHIAVERVLKTLIMTGLPEHDGPQLWVDTERCEVLHEALSGGYKMKLNKDQTVSDKPEDKHPWCDAIDALSYLLLEEFGIPDTVKQKMRARSEEEQEDSQDDDYAPRQRSRC